MEYRGFDIIKKNDLVGGHYYIAPLLNVVKAPVNFAPTILEVKEFIDRELK